MKQIFGLVLLCVLLVEGCALRSGGGDRSSSYRNEEYGFTMSLPPGWREDKLLSREAMEQVRSAEKEGLAVAFVGEEKVDPFGLSLVIIFLSDDPKYQDLSERQRYFDEIKETIAGDPSDKVYLARERTLSGQPAVEVAICTSHEGQREHTCNIVHHIAEIFAPHTRVRVQFNVWKDFYPKYEDKIKQSLASIEISPRTARPLTRCKKSDIQVIEHHWDTGGTVIDITRIKWEATLKNTSQIRCLVKVGFQLLDQEGNILFNDNFTPPHVIDPQQTRKEEGSLSSIDSKDLPKVHTSRVVLIEVQ
jgi:hypothetical protein